MKCECGASVDGAINCDHYTKQVEIRLGWCMTDLNRSSGSRQSHDLKSNLTSTVVVGKCSYVPVYNATNRAYTSLPSDPAQLTRTMCNHYHRTGLLCGQCVDGYGPAVYSFGLHCSNCSDMSVATAVILHMLLEFLPSGLFFVFIMVFNISIMSGPMFGYFVFCQSFVFAIRSQPQVYNSVLLFLPSPLVSLTRVSMTLSAAWNLLFFRFVAPPFCISSKLTGIHISMLGFVTALFPLGLIIIVCAGYELNIQNMRGVRSISNLLNKLYSKMNTNISSTHNSVIRAFATFILMSIALVTFQTHSIVSSRSVYNVSGQVVRRVLYSDPNIVLSLSLPAFCCVSHVCPSSVSGASSDFVSHLPLRGAGTTHQSTETNCHQNICRNFPRVFQGWSQQYKRLSCYTWAVHTNLCGLHHCRQRDPLH